MEGGLRIALSLTMRCCRTNSPAHSAPPNLPKSAGVRNNESRDSNMEVNFEKVIALLALFATIPVYKGWMLGVVQWNRQRKLASLEKRASHYRNLNKDSGYLLRWASESILLVVALVAAALMFEGVAADENGRPLASALTSLLATIAYVTATFKLGQLTRLKHLDSTMASIDEKIDELKS